jgi:hypothetical protein
MGTENSIKKNVPHAERSARCSVLEIVIKPGKTDDSEGPLPPDLESKRPIHLGYVDKGVRLRHDSVRVILNDGGQLVG